MFNIHDHIRVFRLVQTGFRHFKRLYKEVLLDVVHRLENDQKEELRFYFSELIVPKEDKGALNILRSLQNSGKISWKDLCVLKDGLRVIQRWDLVNTLTTYEVQRNVIILLDTYARKRKTSEIFYPQVLGSVHKVAKYLEYVVAEVVRDNVEIANAVGSLMQSRMGIRKALANCEEEIEGEMSDPWSKLTLLVIIAGEMFAAVLSNNGARERSEGQQKREVLKTCFIMVEELSTWMIKLGNWEDFSSFVEKRYHLICPVENSGLDADSLNSKRKITEMIQLFKKSSFFCSSPKFGSTETQNAGKLLAD